MLAVVAGVLMSFFYRFVAAAMDLDNFAAPTPGMLTPYSAIFVFSVGVLLSNFVFNTYAMRRPFVGAPVSYREYFRGSLPTHLVGMLGGAVWCLEQPSATSPPARPGPPSPTRSDRVRR